ncbi:MAG: DoxX family membrane protein, partial [Burkholderiales bacterium]
MSALARANASWNKLLGWLGVLTPLVDLLIRYDVARAFFSSGLTKIDSWDKTVFLFQEEYHVPLLPPELAAFLGTFGELFFPPL